jgi:hypothetical protein
MREMNHTVVHGDEPLMFQSKERTLVILLTRSLWADLLEQLADDVIAADAGCISIKRRDNSVTQHRRSHGSNITGGHVESSLKD